MSDLSARLEGLSPSERAALREILRRKKGEAAAPAAARTEARPAEAPAAPRGAWEEGGTAPASFAQERLWLIDQLAPGTAIYNIPGALRLRGPLDVPALLRAVSEIVRRQASLRTVLLSEAGRPVQRILPWAPPGFPWVDLSALPAEAREAEVLRRSAAEAERPFDLARGPLFRFTLLFLGPCEHVALYTMHHVVSDGWSTNVFYRELAVLYEAFASRRPSPLAPLPRQLADLAVEQRSRPGEERLAGQLAWWKERLAGLEALELPFDHPRPAARSGRGVIWPAAWRAELAPRLAAWGRGEGGTLYMVLLAAFQALLSRISGQDDVAVGSPVANRTAQEMEPLIGCFVNTVVMRTGLAGDPPFRELLARVRTTAVEAYRHQEAPFERVVEAVQPERQLSRAPLFQVLFVLQSTEAQTLELAGLSLEPVSAPTSTAKLDLTLFTGESPAGFEAHLEIDLDLFEPATADRLLRHLGNLLEGVLEAPETRLSDLPLLGPAEREEILSAWNRTAVEIPRAPVHRLFEAQVDRAPDALALTGGEGLTYAQLDVRANRLAHRLRRMGAGPEVPVVVLAERSADLVAALLAVMKSGAFFVPLDPSHPPERLAFVMARTGARLAVTEERFLALLPDGIESVCLDRDREALAAERPGRPEGGATAQSLLYVMFTSGSTGEPKGVAVTHGNVVRLVQAFPDLGPGATFLMLAPVSFDASTLELWAPLTRGGQLAVFPSHTPSLDELAAFLQEQGVTWLWLTAGLFHQMVDERPEAFAGVSRLLAGGDALSPDHVRRALAAHPGLVLVNGYGPTESTTFATCHPLTAPEQVGATVPIGLPIANTAVHVLEPGLAPAPLGVRGELWIGGAGLARGYFGRPDLTAERFVPDPFGEPGGRLYRTGDRVRRRPAGVLEFHDRLDRQVKIRGYRIEPAEIEAVLAAHPEVAEAAVVVRGEGSDKRLVAYVASAGVEDDLRGWLAARLPEPMVPAAVVVLERLPLTPNGKVDRRALSRIVPERKTAGYVEPRSPAERTLAGLWLEILGAERTGGRVGVYDHFFALGGHSLLATRLVAAIRDVCGAELPLRIVFERPVLEEMATAVEEARGSEVADSSSEEAAGPAPLSFSQERLWLLDQIDPGTAAYNIPGAFRLLGPLDVGAVARSVAEIVRRHEALRTTFAVEAGGPVQRVEPFDPAHPAARLPLVDLSALPVPARSGELERRLREEAARPFDLAAGPLFRAVLVRLGPEEHAALYTMHHIVSDGWSMGVFSAEVEALYDAFAAAPAGRHPSPLPPLPLQYPAFARRQRARLAGAVLESGLAAWRRLLAGVEPLELPTDRPRPTARSWRGTVVPFRLDAAATERLREVAAGGQATPYMALLALFQTFLHRLSRQEDVVVGSPVANRRERDLEGLIGFFVNNVVLRADLSGDPPFREALRRVRLAAVEAFQLQEVPFEKVVEALQPERHRARMPLFQVAMTLQAAAPPRPPRAGLVLEPLTPPRETAKFDLSLEADETADGLGGGLEIDLDLFDPATAVRWSRHLATLIEAAVDAPDRRISQLPLLTPPEREEIVLAWNRTAVPIPDLPVHRLFEEQVDRAPEAPAISSDEENWTYRELEERANRLAHHLRRMGIGPEVPVVVLAERSPDLIATFLGVSKSGGFFVPLDPWHPRERLAALISRAGARLAVTRERFLELLPEGVAGVCLDRDRAALAAEPARRPDGGATAQSPMYLMFTSGSTGEPKGVVVTHGNVAGLVKGTDYAALGPGETVLALAPLSFDGSTFELWGPLANGGRIALFPPHTPALDELAAFLERRGVTQALVTAALFHQIAERRPESFAPLRGLLTGGEAVAPALARRVVEALPGLVLSDAYGPTETTCLSTVWRLTREETSRPSLAIGLPIANTTAHVLEPEWEPAPLGVWGELCLGGQGVARGYLGRPDLTAERFVPDPFGLTEGGRLYRTGDLSRRRPDGALEFLGRVDRQVKIRGFRIEPGEIETVLTRHPAVAEAAVLVRGDAGDKRLVAYVAGEAGLSGPDLRRWLAGQLPEPMVPAAVVVLDRLPLTPNRKVDRGALARIAPERAAGDDYVAPRTPAEQALAALWLDLLGPERTGGRVGVHDHFFELGGHSLLATRLVAAVRDTLQAELPLRVVFERPTLEAVARAVEEAASIPAANEEVEETGPAPLSYSQERLWLLEQIDPGTSAYNVPGGLRLHGRLDVPALGRAVAEIVRRHDALRTTFGIEEGRAIQRVEPFSAGMPLARLPLVDLGGLPAEARSAEVERLAAAEVLRPFDLAAGPLFRSTLLRLDAGEHVALYTMHHIVSDGWSMGVFFREVAVLYAAFAAGRPSPLPPLPLQYTGYARRQRARVTGERLEEGLETWRRILDGVPPLELPADRPRPVVRSWRGAHAPVSLDAQATSRLAALGRDEQATLYMALLAALQTFLHRLAWQDDVAVGTAVANRTDRDVEGLIGFFVNTLVLRSDLSGDPPFREVLRRARQTALEAFRLQEIPFEKVVEAVQPERHTSRSPLFQVMLTLQNTPGRNESLAGLDLEPVAAPWETAKFDLTLSFHEGPDGLSGTVEFDLDLFDPATGERMARHLATLIGSAVAAPEGRISEIPLLSPLEREQIVLAWNRTAVRIPQNLPVHRLFEEQVDRAPDAVAIVAEGEELTYRQLDALANLLAHRLRRLGAGPEVPVVVLAERSPGLVAALLAVMKSGGFFVPLDPSHPRERLAGLLGQAGAHLAVTQERFLDLLPEGIESVCLEHDLTAEPESRPDGGATGRNLAYVMFTSGSTGEPKGVAVTHGNVVRLVRPAPFAEPGPGATFLMLAPVSFDASTLELWGPLTNGGRVAVFPPHTPSLDELAAFLRRFGVDRLWLTAGLFHQMVDERPEAFAGLVRLLAGGDALSPDHVRRVLAAHPGLVLVNGYGPTESTTFATCHPLTASDQVGTTVPIGAPIPNTRVHILEPGLDPAPLGIWGELCVGGEGLARGYLNRPELTAERFVPDPFATLQGVLGGRLYRTGDLARRRPDGVLEFLGRIDRQVKIRGFRIEPGEIEAVLAGHPAVSAAAVVVRGEGADKRLVAYVAGGDDDLRRWLAGRLPEPMVPASVVVLDRLPLTPNGKVDRRALEKIAPERSTAEDYVAPRTPAEQALAELWIEVLGGERTGGRLGVHDNFFTLGGHSLLATRLMAAVRDVFAVELPLRVLFERPTLEEVARAVEEAQGVEVVDLPGEEETGPPPLSFSQERLWLLEQIDPGTAAYNIPGGFRLHGCLDAAALAGAVAEIVRRHDALRTTFAAGEDGPVQHVDLFSPDRPVARLPLIDLGALPEDVRNAEALRLATAEALRPFDLAAGPLFRAALLRVGREEHVALYTMHHIVSDGWSMGVFFREVAVLYAAFAAGRPSPLQPLALQYTDFARRQRARLSGARLEEGLAAWRRILEGVPPLELPADRPRPAVRSWRGGRLPVSLGPDAAAGLAALVKDGQGTLYMSLLAAFQTFLHRFSGQNDVAVGTAIANRTDRDVGELIGFFVNSLVLRTDLSGDPPFREVVRRARQTALEAFQLQEIPFEKVVEAVQPERHTTRAPLFQVMLNLQNTPQPAAPLAGLALELVDSSGGTAKFDLTLGFAEGPAGLDGSMEYDLDLFDPPTAERMAHHLATLVRAAVAEPERRISEIPLLDALEREQIVLAWNRTSVRLPRNATMHGLFEEQVDRAPNAVAVTGEGVELTYAQLDALANRLAHRLRRLGAGPEVAVVVLAERSPALIAALLAVMKSGAFFVPLDPAFPPERLATVIDRSGARLVVTRERFLDVLPEGVEAVSLDDDLSAEPESRPAAGAVPGNLLYVMFTSGSTGEPKGVGVTHGNVVRLVRGTDFADLGPGETFLMLSTVSFDLSTLELWGPLSNGGRVAVFPPHTPSLDELSSFLQRFGVTQLWLTAGLFHQMVDERPEAFVGLRRLLAGGDVVSAAHARKLLAARPGLVLVDGYGPTESTTFATCHALTAPEQVGATVPIGSPIGNTTVHILEPGPYLIDQPAPIGVWGELCIGGLGLARGYLGRPDLTAERFVPDPFATLQGVLGGRLYRSGDLARRRPDGVLEFLGRIDRQVKIRGFRVEPGEVEAILSAHPAVAEAAVLVRGEGEDKRLVAYVASEPADGGELRRWLAGRLPEAMVPAAVVVLDRLPLTPNGKVDRRELAKITPERNADDEYVAPRTPVEEILAGLFLEILGAERTGGRVGAGDSFFELGGHSLAATRLVSRLRTALGVELPLRAVFEAPTVERLAARCEAAGSAAVAVLVPVPRDPAGDPLSFSQERLWFLDRLTPGTATYNLPSGLRLRGPLDPERLARCLAEVSRRHEVLRSRFELRGGVPVQVVDPAASFPLPLVDLTGLHEELRRGEAERLAAEEAERPFDLERGPLVRAILVRLASEEHDALLNLHHIVTDGWSMGILYGEVGVLYRAFSEGRPAPLPELPVQYADVARWQREQLAGAALEEQLSWWRERLAGAPPSLDLPLDRMRPPVQTFRGAVVPGGVPAELAGRLRALAHREGSSLFMLLLAASSLLFGRLSSQEDVVVGTPVAGRTRPEMESLIGLFLNTLVLRVGLEGGLTARALLARAREAALGAYAHQDVPFEKLLEDLQPERDLSRTPLFQVFLNMLNFPEAGARLPDGLILEPLDGTLADSKFDLTVYAGEADGGLSLAFVYNSDLFDRARIEEMQRQLQSILAQIVEEPDAPVDAITLLTPEAAAVLPDPRAPLDDAWIGAVHSLFAEQVRRRPERPAVSDAEGAWSYGELGEAVARLAARLRADGLEREEAVAIWAHRGAPAAWAVMAAAWAGGAFVLLDPAYPPERLVTLLELAEPRYWIEIAAAGAPPEEVEGALRRFSSAGMLRGRVVLPGGGPAGARALVETLPAPAEPAEVGPDGRAYIAFTSGSTGLPKGIEGRHGPLSHFLPFLRERFGLTDEDRTSLLSGLAHDPLQRDIFTPLCLGAALIAPTADEIATPGRLAAWMAREGITISHLTPAMAQLLTEGSEGVEIPTLRWVLLVGDVLTRLDVDRLRRIAPRVTCVNLYGSTETQRSVAFHVVGEEEIADARAPQVLPLGRGMRDVQLLVVSRSSNPEATRLAGIGEVGEIWMRGPHLARGYLGDEALTADRFRINPFTGEPGDRVYRTGDLGRYRPDGEAAFAGRSDFQVKIRGFRIELGEIEAALGRLPGVREAVVIARDDGGGRHLAAYVVPMGEEPDPRSLRDALRKTLPDYMVPAAYVTLDRLPLTPNRKVDRRALPAPDRGRDGDAFVAPEGPVEELLAEAWRDLLGVARIGALDGFFDLGGHSLLASRLLTRVRVVLGVELPLRRIFERPVLRDLAREIAALRAAGAEEAVPPLSRVPHDRPLPLSFQQERLWFLDQLEPGLATYNIAAAVRLNGRLEVPVLVEALAGIVRRHEVLRTTYGNAAEGALQTVHPPGPVPLPVVDLGALPEPRREEATARLAREEAARPFDLNRGPVLRLTLLRLADAEHVALLTFHHIATDGWSLAIFLNELAAAYAALAAGRPSPLSELPVQYADYAVWQRQWLTGAVLEEQAGYWRRALAGLPDLLDLPTDRPRPAVQSGRGAQTGAGLQPDLAAGLARLAREQGATLFMTLIAGWAALLHRWSGSEDVAIGTPVAHRNRSEIEGLVGFFANTLVLRVDLAGAPSFAELAARVREASLGAFSHQDVPFEKLVEELAPQRSLSHSPLFQVLFALQNTPLADLSAAELSLSPVAADSGASPFDLSLSLVPGPAEIGGKLTYSRDLFDAATVERLLGHFRTLLTAAAADAGARIGEIPLLSPEERGQLVEWNRTGAEIPPVGLHELIEAQAARTPDAVAVEDLAGGRLTYRELDEQAERLALSLERLGVGPEALVGISLDRSVEMLVALLAVLKAGGGYLPLDPALPQERLDYMQADSGVRVVLTPERLRSLDGAGETVRRRRTPALPDQVAYVLYTSGSTGRPKGVQVVHSALVNFLLSMSRRPGLRSDDTLLAVTTLSFDIAALELYLPLVVGARVRIASREVASDGTLLAQALAAPEVTVLQATPATWRMLLDAGWTGKPDLVALCGGEALPRDLADRLLASTGALWNVYGPTETTIWSTVERISGPGPISIGRPLANTRIEVLSSALEPVPVGAPGELCIAGAGLARGYLGRPELTADRFIPDPASLDGERLYRTGDLARWRPDGRLDCLGRIDTQVKVRGFRIELGEIEAVLGRLPDVREAAVVVREEGGERFLAAYVVPAGAEPDPGALREALRTALPDYMVPSAFVMLDRLPLTPSRKVDRRALLQIAPERTAGTGHVAPRTPVEETLAGLFVEVLGAGRTGGRVGVHDSFFALGGHSLLATRLMAAVRDAFQVELPLRVLFEKPTVEQLATAVAEAGDAPVDEPVARAPRESGINRFPVSFSQLREWILDRLEPGNPAYNIPNNLRIGGPLSIPVLTEALHRLVERHEVFRTAFEPGEEEPIQVILPKAEIGLPVIDLAALPEKAQEAELAYRVRHHARLGFDLATAPLLRARVLHLAPDDHVLLMTVHHIVSDGWSMGILNQELAALYEAAAAGAPSPLPPLPVQYADYAVWLRGRLAGDALERQAGYWRQRLAGVPPLLELPADRPRPPVRSGRGARVPFFLPQPLAGRLEDLARQRGATLFMVLLAGYQSLLARWSGQEDVVVGTYSGNRPRRELEGLIGFFVNTLVLRTGLAGDPSFADLVARVRETTLGAYAHRDLPFEKLLEVLQLPRDPSRTPLFQALLVLQNFPPTQADLSTGVRLSTLPVGTEKADYDVALWLAEGPEGVAGEFEYSTDLFDEATLVRFAGQLRTLLEGAVAEPDRNVWTLPLIGDDEQAHLLEAWSRGPAVPEGPALLHRLVEEQAARTPTAVAVEAGDVQLTYADLVEQARRFAEGVSPGTIVALAAERTPELIVRMLGVLQAGAAYLPIDPAYPQERREFMLEDSGAKDFKVIKDDNGSPPLMSLATSPSFDSAPAYVIYTSGSTGRPKGVVVPHQAIASFVRAARETYGIGPGDRVLQFASISFDTSAEEIWPALASGATLVLRPQEMAASIPHFLRELERLGITHLDLPTAFWHEMVEGMEAENLELPRDLRLIILGGEEALADRFALWQRRAGSSVRLVNTYGPTETTIVATRRELSDLAPGGTVPIGRPIPGAQAYVLDRFLAPVPPGVRGELWIGGAGVARGYLGRPDLTAERFVPDPFSQEPGARLYRTGDLAVLKPDGDLVFAGRADRQLKIRGYRIEPGEIEAALRLHPALRDAVVDVRGPRDVQRLIAWIVPHEGIEAPGASDLRAFLRGSLPEPLLPAVFVPVGALPLTPGGKVDRRALPEPMEARPEGVSFAEPQSALERTIATVYADLLRVARVGLHDNFFDLGGHSLLIVRAHQKLKEALGREIPVLDLFRFPTVAGLARHLGGEETGQLQKVQGLAEQQRAAQQRQRAAMERLRRPGRRTNE